MSMTVPPRDGALPDPSPSVVLADERALRTAFMSEYRGLAEEARTDLGTAAILSQKVVEGAFVRAWDARLKIKTAEELHQFLVDDVHQASARALHRRAAAHRLSGATSHEATAGSAPSIDIDPDLAWAHIQDALHGEHSAQALSEAASISRHDAAHHIASATREQAWRVPLALGVAALVALVALLWWADRRGDDKKLARALDASDTRVVTSPSGSVGIVTLDDGSRVRLAPDSKLSIPATFGDRVRGVALEGAAAFEVAPGKSREFRVRARNSYVVATGTAFTVRAYGADSGVLVDVTSGSVDIHHGDVTTTMPSGEALFLAEGAPVRPASPAEKESASGWASGVLTIDDRPLREVLPQLRRWYGIDVTVPDPALLNRHVTVRASLDSSRQVIRGIEKSTGLEFGYQGRSMVFGEPGKVAPAKATP